MSSPPASRALRRSCDGEVALRVEVQRYGSCKLFVMS